MTKKAKYRIVESAPGEFAIQRRGLLWGWSYVTNLWDDHIHRPSVAEAEKLVRDWLEYERHTVTVVKEVI